VSNYYIGEPVTDSEVAAIQAAAEKLGLSILNTRFVVAFDHGLDCRPEIWMSSISKDASGDYTLLIASSQTKPSSTHDLNLESGTAKLTIQYGDFATPLHKAASALQEVCRFVIF